MKCSSIFLLAALYLPAISSASPSIERHPTGFRKYYGKDYIEVVCPDAKSSHCALVIQTRGGSFKHKIALSQYGYARAWDPIGAFIEDQSTANEKVPFYFSVDCLKEDYGYVNKVNGEVECTIEGEADKKGVVLKRVKIAPVSGDEPYEYREL